MAGQFQVVASNACLNINSAGTGFIWGGSTVDGEFACNAGALGSASNTFTSYFAGRQGPLEIFLV